MPIITVVRAVQKLRFSFQHFLYRNAFPPQLQVAFPSGYLEQQNSAQNEGSILDDFLWFAAPKSKISPGRKKEKHGRFYPDRVNWIPCERCGEAKLPHKICTKNAELCSMRKEDWEKQKKSESAAKP